MTDDKTNIRAELDYSDAEWTRAEPAGGGQADVYEVAHVTHKDGVTYTLVRNADEAANNPDAHVLYFTPTEWAAFTAGALDGEFDQPDNN